MIPETMPVIESLKARRHLAAMMALDRELDRTGAKGSGRALGAKSIRHIDRESFFHLL